MTTASAPPHPDPRRLHREQGHPRLRCALRMDQARSLRSTVFSLLAAVAASSGCHAGPVLRWRTGRRGTGRRHVRPDDSLSIFLAQLAIGVLGVLLFTGEYATGMIRATFAAVPAGCPCCGPRPPFSRRRP